ncbi:MAG: glycosyltransferase family 2 protein [Lentisphaerae bacterium]|nr:glycosyltransferase family 2 protein [Lentisphaerota bacterium]MCP4100019.1 glycosyltransferase family 2 protein [Lentisphaerota bacterium]
MIDILLASYNSKNYISKQIDSIINQDMDNWRLLIRDGGSCDQTLEIVASYCSKYPDKIQLIQSKGKSCTKSNFSKLIQASSAPYIMFSDHDDIWLNDKVSKSFAKMRETEEAVKKDTPILVFTDKYVINKNKAIIAESCFCYQSLQPAKIKLNKLLVQNIPSGCTMLINRVLLELAAPVPDTEVMHDHWISLVAAAFGHIVYLDESTLLYRQYAGNIFGASEYGIKYLIRKALTGRKALKNRFLQDVNQAAAFLERYEKELTADQITFLADFVKLKNCSTFKAWRVLFKHRIFKHGFMRNLGVFLLFI